MKIGVITFSDFNTNYGSMLQAFSLKTYLETLGHEVKFIRYREYNKDLFCEFSLKERTIIEIKKMILSVYALFHQKDIKKTKANFARFRQQFLNHTELMTSNEQLKEELEEFDCYICGSDQIWNINGLGGLRKPYFLDFAPDTKKKIAYAASMGEYIINDQNRDELRTLINRLDDISLRESTGVEQVSKLTEKKVYEVVDPVFLTSSKEWEQYLEGIDYPNQEYGVCYFVRRSKFGKNLVKRASKIYKMPIYNLSDNMIYVNGTSTKYISAGPLQFVALIKNAKFAIGTSFHLAAFSVLFNTPVVVAGMETNRNRVANLFRLVKMEHCFVTESDNYERTIRELFFEKCDKTELERQIVKSKEFLINAIGVKQQKNNLQHD